MAEHGARVAHDVAAMLAVHEEDDVGVLGRHGHVVAHHHHAQAPGRYVGAAEVEDDGEPIEEKIARLKKELFEQFEESERLAAVVREQLGRVS